MRAPKKSYIIRIPVDAAEIPVLFGRGSARRSISAILTTTVTTTTIHALVRPDNGNRDCRTTSHAKPPRRKARKTRNPEHLASQNRPELPNVEREPRTVHLLRALGSLRVLPSFPFLPPSFASWRLCVRSCQPQREFRRAANLRSHSRTHVLQYPGLAAQ
ncbi:MAG: hypothetical protein QOH31_3147 [Verrucomicrobiota bacterium]|jgi:hypothetical protein